MEHIESLGDNSKQIQREKESNYNLIRAEDLKNEEFIRG